MKCRLDSKPIWPYSMLTGIKTIQMFNPDVASTAYCLWSWCRSAPLRHTDNPWCHTSIDKEAGWLQPRRREGTASSYIYHTKYTEKYPSTCFRKAWDVNLDIRKMQVKAARARRGRRQVHLPRIRSDSTSRSAGFKHALPFLSQP